MFVITRYVTYRVDKRCCALVGCRLDPGQIPDVLQSSSHRVDALNHSFLIRRVLQVGSSGYVGVQLGSNGQATT